MFKKKIKLKIKNKVYINYLTLSTFVPSTFFQKLDLQIGYLEFKKY